MSMFPNFENKLELIRKLLSANTLDTAAAYLDRKAVHTILWTAFYNLYLDTLNVGYISKERLGVLERLFEVFVDTWAKIEEEKKLKEEEKQKLFKYKTKDHSVESQDVQDERDLRELFPNFEDAFADLQLDDNNPGSSDVQVSEPTEVIDAMAILKASFNEGELYRLYRLHKLIFERYKTQLKEVPSTNANAKDRLESIRLSYELNSMIYRSFNYQIDRLDDISIGSHLVMASRVLDQMQNGDGLSEQSSDALSAGLVHNIYKVFHFTRDTILTT